MTHRFNNNNVVHTAQVASSTSFAHYFYMELNEPLSGATVKDVNDNMQVLAPPVL